MPIKKIKEIIKLCVGVEKPQQPSPQSGLLVQRMSLGRVKKKHHKFLFQLIFSTIGEPKGRGKIEQFFITVNQLLLAKLPGYAPLGHKFPNPVLNLALLEKEFESCLFN